MEYTTGLFALAGAVIAGFFTLLAAHVGHNANRAQRHIRRLADQVAAFCQLEQLYMAEVAELDPDRGAPRTIQMEMRDRVESEAAFERPGMSARQALDLKAKWG